MICRMALLLALVPSGVTAQQTAIYERAQDFSITFIASLEPESEVECRAALLERKTRYADVGAGSLKPLLLILEGQRLVCETRRLGSEVERLAGERGRLLSEVDRLNEDFRLSGLSPFPGHDRSQQVMLADVRGIETTIRTLEIVQRSLQQESDRILRLAVADAAALSESNGQLMRVAIDADAQKSIFDSFRDLLPKAQA